MTRTTKIRPRQTTAAYSFIALSLAGVLALAAAGITLQIDDGIPGAHAAVASVLNSAIMVTRGVNHTCAVTALGAAFCWGKNDYGQLGNGSTADSSVPVQVLGLTSNVVAITGGKGHTCALLTGAGGGVRCWGRNYAGQLGDGTTNTSAVPVIVTDTSNFVGIAAGGSQTCAWTSTGGAKCWGYGGNGELGNGSSANSSVPVDVNGLPSGVSEIAAGYSHTCALTTAGAVKCWGYGGEGRLGNNSSLPSAVPVDVVGLSSGVVSLSAGRMHNCAVMNTGVAMCWGYNAGGQLGVGDNTNRFVPTAITALSNTVTLLAAGFSHTCAKLSSGTVYCWGNNDSGQLGTSGGDTNVPVAASNVNGSISALTADDRNTCLLTTAGGVKCWGNNASGQLGNASQTNTDTPVDVIGFGSVPPSPPPPSPTSTPPIPTSQTPSPPTPTLSPPSPTPTVPPSGIGDAYEPDDTCATARAVPADGHVQSHTFHQLADEDWETFAAISGTTYIVRAEVPPESPADVTLELYTQCNALPQGQNFAFSPGVYLEFTAPSSGPVFLKWTNGDASRFGNAVRYQTSVTTRAVTPPQGAVIIVAGRISASDSLQTNIYHVTDAVYKMFLDHGYPSDRIKYLANDTSRPGWGALANSANLQAAITQWAPSKLANGSPLTIYMMDHGGRGQFFLDNTSGQVLTPAQLNTWLSTLEGEFTGLKVNIIIEACYSGGFITLPGSLSKPGRVVIASTTDDAVAFASATGGATFSDHFVTALDRGQSLFDAFLRGNWASTIAHQQRALIDDDGDGRANTATDGLEAQRRGFTFAGSFPDSANIASQRWPPYIPQADSQPTDSTSTRTIRAQILDNSHVANAYAVIYPPGYQPPTSPDAMVKESLSTATLLDNGNGWFTAKWPGFTQIGTYRIVVNATDDHGELAQPYESFVTIGTQVFVPLVVK